MHIVVPCNPHKTWLEDHQHIVGKQLLHDLLVLQQHPSQQLLQADPSAVAARWQRLEHCSVLFWHTIYVQTLRFL